MIMVMIMMFDVNVELLWIKAFAKCITVNAAMYLHKWKMGGLTVIHFRVYTKPNSLHNVCKDLCLNPNNK